MGQIALTADQIVRDGLGAALGVAYLGGLLTAFTPCVYPLIPVTIGITGARAAVHRGRSFLLLICFTLGLALIYSLLGFAAASTGRLLGSLAQDPRLIGGVALLFLVMGLALLGLFDLRVPERLTRLLSRYGGSGYAGSFVLGMVSGVFAAPCSGPVVVGILAYVAQRSNPTAGFFLLFLFSLGLATPFVVLGTFSQAIARLPRSGPWTEWVKHLCGLALIAAAFLYARPILPPWLFRVLVASAFFAVALFGRRIFPVLAGRPAVPVALRIAAAVAGIWFLWAGAPAGGPEAGRSERAPAWESDFKGALERAAREKRPVVVDFWAEWCAACKELDARTYSDPAVIELLDRKFVSVKIDATDSNRAPADEVIRAYGVTGLPTVLFLDPTTGKAWADLTLTGFVPAGEFRATLGKVLAKTRS